MSDSRDATADGQKLYVVKESWTAEKVKDPSFVHQPERSKGTGPGGERDRFNPSPAPRFAR